MSFIQSSEIYVGVHSNMAARTSSYDVKIIITAMTSSGTLYGTTSKPHSYLSLLRCLITLIRRFAGSIPINGLECFIIETPCISFPIFHRIMW